MKIFVLGSSGLMGKPVCYAMQKLGHEIIALDKVLTNNYKWMCLDIQANKYVLSDMIKYENPDLVISCLPYYNNQDAAEICFKNKINYCDLGGDIQTSININEMIRDYGMTHSITDLGLAPGLVNILAEELYQNYQDDNIKSIYMYCGGLPQHPIEKYSPVYHAITWSVDGLIKEYTNKCRIIDKGHIKYVDGMSDSTRIYTDNFLFEARHTSGGAAYTIDTMFKRGVKNCYYKTLRHEQHWKLADFLINGCELEEIPLKEIFCHYRTKNDMVVIQIDVFFLNKENISKSWKINCDSNLTAMQKATGFSLASVADLLNKNNDSIYDYSSIPIKEFRNNMDKLGIDI